MIRLVLIPLCILFLPWVIARFVLQTSATAQLPYLRYALYLWVATGLWLAAFVVPDVSVGDTTTFVQHLVGGLVAAVLFGYVVRVYRVVFTRRWQMAVALYFFASGLGVANELFELLLNTTGITTINGRDTWWDLLANTLGAYVGLALVLLCWRLRSKHTDSHVVHK